MNYDNIATSAVANILTIVAGGLVYILKRKCRHSSCESNTCGIHIDISKSDDLSSEVKIGVQELHKADGSRLSPKRETSL